MDAMTRGTMRPTAGRICTSESVSADSESSGLEDEWTLRPIFVTSRVVCANAPTRAVDAHDIAVDDNAVTPHQQFEQWIVVFCWIDGGDGRICDELAAIESTLETKNSQFGKAQHRHSEAPFDL